MTTIEITFYKTRKEDNAQPYITDDSGTEYICDGSGGSITFDGYYYIEDQAPPYGGEPQYMPRFSEHLPKVVDIYVRRRDTEPEREEYDPATMCTRTFYKNMEEFWQRIEIYRRVKHECTNQISEIEDYDGSLMKVCFFPTDKQTIYFRLVNS
jgi:hypothetical protein